MPSSTRKPARQIEGGLIGIERDGILGWAFNPAAPDAPVRVRLMAGGQTVAQAIANRYDDPRLRVVAGPGRPGFSTRLALPPPCAYPFQLTLHTEDGTPLGVPLPIRAAREIAALIGPTPPDTYEGHIDGVFDGRLMGWVRNRTDPDHAVELELTDGGSPIARAIADRLREDLRNAGLHHGRYGYAFDLPAALLDGHPHSLSVRVAGTAIDLLGGPIAFGPLAASALISQIAALQVQVTRLRNEVDSLIQQDGPVQRNIMRILAERIAAQAEIAREQTAREIDALRTMVFAAADARERSANAAPETYNQPALPTQGRPRPARSRA